MLMIMAALLLGGAVAFPLYLTGMEMKRALIVGLLIAVGACCLGSVIQGALLPKL